MSVETVGGSPFVELGNNIPVYAEGQFLSDRAVVKGPTATVSIICWTSRAIARSTTSIPRWRCSTTRVTRSRRLAQAWKSPSWANGCLLPDPLNLILTMPIQAPGLVLSEVGFICALGGDHCSRGLHPFAQQPLNMSWWTMWRLTRSPAALTRCIVSQ